MDLPRFAKLVGRREITSRVGYILYGQFFSILPLSAEADGQTLASLASHRSNCMKRRVGALLVRSKRILSTGYNGTPRGTRNCNHGGCRRCNGSARGGEARGSYIAQKGIDELIKGSGRMSVSTCGGKCSTRSWSGENRRGFGDLLQHVHLFPFLFHLVFSPYN